ncbi:hypothetical protein GBA52_017979 [Prunus armeniaca]|nr:hypothetical protein GBA52_017979 [Prunus armeniaca]
MPAVNFLISFPSSLTALPGPQSSFIFSPFPYLPFLLARNPPPPPFFIFLFFWFFTSITLRSTSPATLVFFFLV